MRISYNWLRELIDIDWTPQELADNITMAGIEVDTISEENGDYIIEAELTPNRGDALGMINLAHEVAGLCGGELHLPEFNVIENSENIENFINVTIEDPKLCYRYTARLIKNVKIGPSPMWMQEKLIAAGIRPINNVVDITNFVMMETNQPLHAFDYDLIRSKQIVIRRAKNNEQFTTLDEINRTLDENDLVISDGLDRAVALAGIMGGQNSEIQDDTKNVLLESAVFNGYNIRKTSRKLNLRSESSIRFEKGCDVQNVARVSDRAASLLQEYAGGEVVGGIFDAYPVILEEKKIKMRTSRVNKLLGLNLSNEEIVSCLTRLGMKAEVIDNAYLITVPSWRPDITMEVDLIEEVARIYGYERIPATLPNELTTVGELTPWQSFIDMVRNILSETMLETLNYSFISPKSWDMLLLPKDSEYRKNVIIANPLSEEQSVMRTMLLPGILNTAARNLSRQNESLQMYEIGRVFYPINIDENLVKEETLLGGIITGHLATSWLKSEVPLDFFYLKGILEGLFAHLGLNIHYEATKEQEYLHPGRAAKILALTGDVIGIIGEIHPLVQKNFALKERACVFEINLEKLFDLYSGRMMMQNFSRFPMVSRDLAVLVKDDISAETMLGAVRDLKIDNLIQYRIFDVYVGEQVGKGNKSIALKFVFQASDHTLTDVEVGEYMKQIMDRLEETAGAVIR